MARSRNIKPGFFKNEVLAEMPMEARMLFIGLWTLADREGRLEDRPKRIKMELFAYDSFDVDPMLMRLQTDGFVTRYEVDGVRFIQIENFVKHQDPHYKEKASEIPGPAGVDDIIKATAVTRSQRVRILERDSYTCQCCGATEHLCIDHVIPASRGGDSSDDNLQVLCNSCNTKKGNRLDGEERGTKKSKHNSSAVIVRANVGSNLNQEKSPSPSDSLIPDSLIPDSLISDSLDSEAKASGGEPPVKVIDPAEVIFAVGVPLLIQAGVPEKNARSFLGHMRKKAEGRGGDAAVVDAINRCMEQRALQPVEFIQGCFKDRKQAEADQRAASSAGALKRLGIQPSEVIDA